MSFGHRSCVNKITDDSVSKFPNFRYHGNKDRFLKNSNESVENFFRRDVGTLPGSMHVKFNVRKFSSNFGDLDI